MRRRSRWTPPSPARSFLCPDRGLPGPPVSDLVGLWGGVSDLPDRTSGSSAIAHIKLTLCRRGVNSSSPKTHTVTPVTCQSPCRGHGVLARGTRPRGTGVGRTARPEVPTRRGSQPPDRGAVRARTSVAPAGSLTPWRGCRPRLPSPGPPRPAGPAPWPGAGGDGRPGSGASDGDTRKRPTDGREAAHGSRAERTPPYATSPEGPNRRGPCCPGYRWKVTPSRGTGTHGRWARHFGRGAQRRPEKAGRPAGPPALLTEAHTVAEAAEGPLRGWCGGARSAVR